MYKTVQWKLKTVNKLEVNKYDISNEIDISYSQLEELMLKSQLTSKPSVNPMQSQSKSFQIFLGGGVENRWADSKIYMKIKGPRIAKASSKGRTNLEVLYHLILRLTVISTVE